MSILASAAENAVIAVPVASAIVSLATLIYVAIGLRNSASTKHVANLHVELADARKELDIVDRRLRACETDRENLGRELDRLGRREIELMRLVVNLEGRGHQ